MLELGHAQVGHGDEVLDVAEASGGGLRLLEQAVHRFNVGVAASVEHAAHDAAEVLLQGEGQPLEGLQAAAARPAQPFAHCPLRDLLAVARGCIAIDQPQCLLQAPRTRALQIRALQPVHRLELGTGPAHRVLAHPPQQLTQRLLALCADRFAHRCRRATHLFATHLVHRRVGQRHDMKAIVADPGIGQRLVDSLGVGRAHVDTGVLNGQRIAAVRTHVLGKGLQRSVIAPRGGKQQALGFKVMHDGDVLVTTLDAGLVDPDVAHARHVVLGTGHLDVMAHAAPQALRGNPQLVGRLAHRHLSAQRQTQRLEQQGKAAPLTRPRHRQLRGLAAAVALNARDRGMQPRFELKEIQVTPAAPHPVVDQLVLGPTRRTRSTTAGVLDLEVDPPLGCVELDLGDVPGRLQAKCGGEESFDLGVHRARGRRQCRAVVPPRVMFVEKSISTGNGIEPQNLAQAALAANESNAALKKSLEATEQETRLLRGELDKHRREAMVDPLTGLLNRRGMLIEAAKLFDSSDGPPALLVMDIDHFKRINDTYGHAVGDIVIQKVAEAMLAIAPDQAMTARFGGEEFVMLVPNASIDRAQQLAEKVRTSIERLRLVRRHDKLEIAPFTISVGVALRQREESIEPLFDRADKALYRAKHNGRNCVVASS